MEITGYKYREIYPQTGIVNYQLEVLLDNITGIFFFGFTGDNSSVKFQAKSGRFYLDNSAYPSFLQSYHPNESFTVSGNIGPSSHDLYYNNSPLFFGQPKSTGYLNQFYANADRTVADISLTINGDVPDYYYDPFESYYSGQIIPINIVNQSAFPFRIFSGNVLNNNFSLINSTDVSVSDEYNLELICNSFTNGSQIIPIELYTDFGLQNISFTASGQSLENVSFYLLFGPDIPSVNNGTPSHYTLSARSTTGLELSVSLDYVSGTTGKYYAPAQSIYSGFTGKASGFISGSGNISSYNTGTVSYNNPLIGNETGLGSGYLSSFLYASGNISTDYEITLTGLGSGLISTLATGTGYGIFDINTYVGPNGSNISLYGLTGYGSGYADNYGVFYGTVSGGVPSLFVPYTGTVTGVQISASPSDYEDVIYLSSPFSYTGQYYKYYALTGLAYATGERLFGRFLGDIGFSYEPGIYTFEKNYYTIGTGSSDILTGFNPVLVTQKPLVTTGNMLIVGNTGVSTDNCNFDLPFFQSIDIPNIIYDENGVRVFPLNIGKISLTDTGNYRYENSDYLLTGDSGNVRTKISRLGNTLSGSGFFNNIYQDPFFHGNADYAPSDWGWSETLTGYSYTGYNHGRPPVISEFSANSYFNESGNNESGRMYFHITGENSGLNNYFFKSTPESNSQYSIISLYKTGELLARASGFSDNLHPYNVTTELAYSLPVGASYIYTGLSTGTYYLKSELFNMQDSDKGTVGFTAPVFSGCENWGNLYFSISRGGNKQVPYYGHILVTPYTVDGPTPSADYIPNSGSDVYYEYYLPPYVDYLNFRLPVSNDGNMEVDEKLTATLFIDGEIAGRYGTYSSATLNILDIDSCCTPHGAYCSGTPYVPTNPEFPTPPIIISGVVPIPPITIPPIEPGIPNPIVTPLPNEGGGGGGGYTGGGKTTKDVVPKRKPIPTLKTSYYKLTGESTTVHLDNMSDIIDIGDRKCECKYSNCQCMVGESTGSVVFSYTVGLTNSKVPSSEIMDAALSQGYVGVIALLENGNTLQTLNFVNKSGPYSGVEHRNFSFNNINIKPDAIYTVIISGTSFCANGTCDRETGQLIGDKGAITGSMMSDGIHVFNSQKTWSECIEYTSRQSGCCEDEYRFNEPPASLCICGSMGWGAESPDGAACPTGQHAEPIDHYIAGDLCECSNRGSTITCYTCEDDDTSACDCSSMGYSTGCTGGDTIVGTQNIVITNESCSNYGETVTCYSCACCCPEENGCDCGTGCCCCPSYQAPWGENCACIYTSVGCD